MPAPELTVIPGLVVRRSSIAVVTVKDNVSGSAEIEKEMVIGGLMEEQDRLLGDQDAVRGSQEMLEDIKDNEVVEGPSAENETQPVCIGDNPALLVHESVKERQQGGVTLPTMDLDIDLTCDLFM